MTQDNFQFGNAVKYLICIVYRNLKHFVQTVHYDQIKLVL